MGHSIFVSAARFSHAARPGATRHGRAAEQQELAIDAEPEAFGPRPAPGRGGSTLVSLTASRTIARARLEWACGGARRRRKLALPQRAIAASTMSCRRGVDMLPDQASAAAWRRRRPWRGPRRPRAFGGADLVLACG